MPLEGAETIAELNATWPLAQDMVSEGDDHIRLIKRILLSDAVSQTDLADAIQALQMLVMPPRAIIEWSGPLDEIPPGWALCDGTNGTPDKRDRMTVCAGGAYAVGDTGGAATHTLTQAEMPAHGHGPGNLQGVALGAGAHNHNLRERNGTINNGLTGYHTWTSAGDTEGSDIYENNQPILPVGNHTHPVVVNGGATTVTGGSAAHNNMPPYIAAGYIMKLPYD